jgi:hypothetical protein
MAHALYTENPMVWVPVQIREGAESYLGQHNARLEVAFIPFFADKDAAAACLPLMPKAKGARYEVQAIRYRELAGDAAGNGFLLFRMDAEGTILEKIDPNAG